MSHWNPVSWLEDVEEIGRDLADATAAVATSVADELVDVGNTLVSTGHTIYNDIADGAVATFNTVSGGVVYAVDWTDTEAGQISRYALGAAGDIAHFSVDLYGKAKTWAEDAWRFISSALQSSPPALGPYNPQARDYMKALIMTYVGLESLAESIVTSWERDARKKGYTMAIDFDAAIQLVAVTADLYSGVYVDNTGQWGYLLYVNAAVTIVPALGVALTRDVYMIFGGTSAYNDKSYYIIGATVDIEGFIIGADVLVSSSFEFKGFKAKIGFGLELELFTSGGSKTAKNESSKSTRVEAGGSLGFLDIYSHNLLGEQAPTIAVACDVATDPSQETSITANASAAMTMTSTSIVASDQAGGRGGSSFSDDITNVERIQSITLRGGTMVDAISITYVLHDGSTVVKSHGGTGGAATTLTLADDEYITKVTGRSGSQLDQISFTTSYGRTLTAGGSGGGPFTIDPKVNRPIIGAFGRSSSLIDAFGVFYRSGKPFTLQSKQSSLYLDVTGQMSAADGASTVQHKSTGGPHQHWLLSPGPAENEYYIVNAHTGQYLDAGGTTAGASIVQRTASGADTQVWTLSSTPSGHQAIMNKGTGLYMDVKGGSAETGVDVILWGYHGGANQLWRLGPAPTKVHAFSKGGYTGTFQTFGPGKYNVDALRIGNDTIRSLQVPDGWRVTLYEHYNFSGATQVLTRDAAELASMSGKVSSIVVEMPPWGATVYTDSEYRGTSLTLMPGRYSSLPNLGFKQDTISSVSVPSGWRVTLFEDGDFEGRATVLTSSVSSLKSLDANDTASSLVVEAAPLGQVVLYEHTRYGGISQVLTPGRHNLSELKASGAVGNNAVSSLKVPAGWTVILYKDESYSGSSKTLTADCTDLVDFSDKTSSVVVIPG